MTSVPPPQATDDAPPAPPWQPWHDTDDREPAGLWIAPVAVVIGLCGGVFASVLVLLLGSAFGSSTSSPPPAVNILSSVAFDLAFVAAALYLVATRGRLRAGEFGYVRVGLGRAIAAFVAAGAGYFLLSWLYGAVFNIHSTDKLPGNFGVRTSTWALVGTAAFVCVIAPICEEFFFRGFLFGVLRRMRVTIAGRQAGPWVAAVITGILFGLAHTGSVSSDQFLIPLGFLGFVLCLVRWWSGSLYPCMALHSFNNSLALGVLLGWSVGDVLLLLLASWAAIALLTGPLSTLTADAPRASVPAG
jgi:uncharacterized protein